jgi:hypothetical protein
MIESFGRSLSDALVPRADAISKLVALFTGELRPVESSFPNRDEKMSGDQLAWLAVLVGRFHLANENELTTNVHQLAKDLVESDKETQP